DHPGTLSSRTNLAKAYQAADRWADAEPLFRDVLDRLRQATPPNPAARASVQASLGHCLLKQDKASLAEPLLRECLAIRKKAAPDDWSTYSAQALLGGSLLGQKKFAESEPLLIQGYEGLNARAAKVPPSARLNLTEAGARIVQLYDAWGKPDKAAEWR